MGVQEILDFVKKIGHREEKEELPDEVTRDKYLRSLRRERRVQLEELEKERLIKQIAKHKLERTKKHLFGIKDNKQRKAQLISALNKKKKVEIMREKNSLLKNKKKGKIKNILQENSSWI